MMTQAHPRIQFDDRLPELGLDRWLLVSSILILLVGLLMVTSASMPIAERTTGQPLYFLFRQSAYVALGFGCGFMVFFVPTEKLYRASPWLLFAAIGLLVLVLIPGIGVGVKGSMRWISLKVFNVQPSEIAKLCAFIYIAGYLQRHHNRLADSTMAMLMPLFVLGFAGFLLLLEPDFGSTAVLFCVALGMMFLAGVSLWRYVIMLGSTSMLMWVIVNSAEYRKKRLISFLDPWADAYGEGFQLTQSLIAVGNGELFGTGIGGSVQKLGYLPESYTDFIFAIFAEELGLVGIVVLVLLYLTIIWRSFVIAAWAEWLEMRFAAYLAYGIGLWFGVQAFVNMSVNMGLLPTKGLTLPLISYGGSSVVVMMVALALLFRIDIEVREADPMLTRHRAHKNTATSSSTTAKEQP